MLKHQRNMRKIKKDCLKNMVAGPCLIDEQVLVAKLKPSQVKGYAKKHSMQS